MGRKLVVLDSKGQSAGSLLKNKTKQAKPSVKSTYDMLKGANLPSLASGSTPAKWGDSTYFIYFTKLLG